MKDSVSAHDSAFEHTLGRVLRTGVLLAAAVVAGGAAVYLARRGMDRPDYHLFQGEPVDFRTVTGIVTNARGVSGRGMIQLGLLLLIATPVARVVFAIIGFARQRDWLYVAIASTVLLLLAVSVFGGG